jgi:hypothetical protein
VRPADGLGQTLGLPRHHHQVDVIGHEAISPHVHPVLGARGGHQIQINLIVLVSKERNLTPVATLRDVVRHTRNDRSG